MTWASDLLAKLGGAPYPIGEQALDAWARSEGMPGWTNNPLACGTRWGGSASYNSTGVQVYPSQSAGVAAIAWSLSHSPYTGIGEALRAQATPVTIYRLVNASPWCPGCQNGHYPVALWQLAGSPSGGSAAVPAQPSGAPPTAPGNVETAWGRLQTYAARDFDTQMAQWDGLTRQAERI